MVLSSKKLIQQKENLENNELSIPIPHKFQCRPYQDAAWNAFRTGIKRAVLCWHRGCGKDLFAINWFVRQALAQPAVYLHCFPNYAQGKRAIWKSTHTTHEGESLSYLDHFPKECIKHKNSSDMMLELVNGSIYCVMGIDGKNAQRARGMNPTHIILSEYAYMDPESWHTIEPRVSQNGGMAIFLSTPNGKNHFYDLLQNAKNDSKNYFASVLTLEDTKCLGPDHIELLRKEGVPEDFIQQEYYCSFIRGAQGSYYGKLIQKARDDDRITILPIIPDKPCHTAWDIGIGDSCSIWIFQQRNNDMYNFIQYYENHGEGLEHYIKYLNEFKRANDIEWGRHFVPHDMGNKEFTSGVDRASTAREFGYSMTVLPRKPIDEGIQAARSIIPLSSFHVEKCAYGIKCLDFYRKKYNDNLKIYYDEPCHDKWSHGCFVSGTKIRVFEGEKNIEDIKIGDFVETPNGMRKVLNTFVYDADELLEIFIGNRKIMVTPNHNIFTEKGLIASDSLRYTDIVYTFEDKELCRKKFGSITGEKDLGFRESFLLEMMERPLYLMDSGSEKTETTIEGGKEETSIGMYGHIIMGQFLKDIISIIKMEISKITIFLTWNLYQHQTIPKCIIQKKCDRYQKETSRMLWNMQRNGTRVKKDWNGTDKMEKQFGQNEQQSQKNVYCVKKNIKLGGLIRNIVVQIAKVKHVIDQAWIVKKELVLSAINHLWPINLKQQKRVVKHVRRIDKCTQKVYDFEVENDHCYYANDILVSNSDAYRYAAMGIKAFGLEAGSASSDAEALKKFWG